MRQWSALFMKDFKLTRIVLVIGLVINVLIGMLTLYMERAAGDSLIMFVPLALAVVIHAAYVPIVVFVGLKSEGDQLPLWLHNPQSAYKLLSSKIANGFVMIVISLSTLYAMSRLLAEPKLSLIKPYWTDTWRAGWFVFPHLVWISIELGLWVIVLWALYRYLRLRIGRWSRAAVAGAAILSVAIDSLAKASAPYRLVAEWGGIAYTFPTLSSRSVQTYAGGYVYDFIIIVGLFMLAAWLVDNKVEG